MHIYEICFNFSISLMQSFLMLFEKIFSNTLIKTVHIKNRGNNKDVFNLDEIHLYYNEFNNFCKKFRIEKTIYSYDEFKTTTRKFDDVVELACGQISDPLQFK